MPIRFPLETARLLIRPFALADAEALHAVWGDPDSERFIGASHPPRTVEDTRRILQDLVRDHKLRGFSSWAVVERESGTLIGDCGLFLENGVGPDVELAYGLGRSWWGRGYATEAAAACVRAGFEELGLERIVADVDPANAASVRILEKLGFELVREEGGKRYYAVAREPAPSSK